MKHLLLTIILLVFFTQINAQQTLVLKSGDKLNGVISKIDNSVLYFTFKGNEMTFNIGDISAIYFDEKTIQPATGVTCTSKVDGIVTYFFNYNFGDKPDVGSEVYIVDSSECNNFNKSTIDSLEHLSFYKKLLARRAYNVYPRQVIIDTLTKYGVESDKGYEALDVRADMNYKLLKNSKSAYKLVVDGNGSYSKNLKPGTYYVLIKSNNRKGSDYSNVMGQHYLQVIRLVADDEINVSHNFSIY